MKKAILTFGLFTLVLASTSFAAPTASSSLIADNTVGTSVNATESQDAERTRKIDSNDNQNIMISITKTVSVEGAGNQDSGGHKKID